MSRFARMFHTVVFSLTLFAGAAFADGATVLTVTGAVSQPNRGAFDENTDKFLGFHEVTFDMAHAFSLTDLAGLAQTTIRADFPQGKDLHEFPARHWRLCWPRPGRPGKP